MCDIDYALNWSFIDPDTGRDMQLRFRQNHAPPGDDRVFDGTGQLYAIVVNRHRVDDGDQIAISRPNVAFDDIERALDGWRIWAKIDGDEHGWVGSVNLGAIRRRIEQAGLGPI